MTAEIAVMNQEAIALAADSAVSGPKVFTSANKIFALSKYEPVALMVYDSAQFHWVPWETIIKSYRAQLGKRKFPALDDYALDFFEFVERSRELFPFERQEQGFEVTIRSWLAQLMSRVEESVDEIIERDGGIDESMLRSTIEDELANLRTILESNDRHHTVSATFEADLATGVLEKIDGAAQEFFGGFSFYDELKSEIVGLMLLACVQEEVNTGSPFHSGLVFAGFGEDDYFPGFRAYKVEMIISGWLKYQHEDSGSIKVGNMAQIRAFAQSEQVSIFMEGLDKSVRDALIGYWDGRLAEFVGEILDETGISGEERKRIERSLSERPQEISATFEQELGELQYRTYVAPVIEIVAMMPKDELAAMAESLVNLTSFKRKVTAQEETVGGPIDVAVISKGDGLVWIKRKHYFKPELNPQFFENYYREPAETGGGE